MRAFAALLAKELHAYFAGPLVYLVGAAFLAYTGYYFHSDLVYFVTFGFGMNIMENFWQLVFMDMRLVLILSVPLGRSRHSQVRRERMRRGNVFSWKTNRSEQWVDERRDATAGDYDKEPDQDQ